VATVGDASLWANLFPDYLIPNILELVVTTWQSFQKPHPLDHEVPISRRFGEALRREKDLHELPFTIWAESSETDPNTGKEIARIDIRFLHGWREGVYFAFECKRLRIPYSSRMQSNTGEYVGANGMMRFITGKYGKGLTLGGMIGYIMDGNLSAAVPAVKKTIDKNREDLRLAFGSSLTSSSMMPKERTVKETNHDLATRKFAIYHVFLAV